MPARRPWSLAIAWVAVALSQLAGCSGTAVEREAQDDAVPPPADTSTGIEDPVYTDDLGQPVGGEPIDESTVGETEMLKRRLLFELRGGASAPLPYFEDNEFTPGPLLGFKLELETVKNLYFGLSFDWSQQDVDEGVSSIVVDPDQLPGVGPDQLFDQTTRYNVLAVFDYDIVLVQDTIGKDTPFMFRFGAGAGLVVIDGEEDPQVTFDIKTFYGFALRPAVGLRWQFHPNILAFTELSYDLVFPDEIEARISGEDSTIDGDVDFATLNLIVGIGFTF